MQKISAIILTVLLLSQSHSLAHLHEYSSNVSAMMHITPDDDPVAGEESQIFFKFFDDSGKFKPENCNCTVEILLANELLHSQNLFENTENPNLSNSSLTFVFPKKEIYTLKINGKPKETAAFNEFNLEYSISVEKEINSNVEQNYQKYLVPALVLIILLALASIKFIKK